MIKRSVLIGITLVAIPVLMGGVGGCAPLGVSDRRLKRDVSRVARLAGSVDLYRYKYLWSDQEYVGVMAQDLVETRPDAVIRRDDGFLMVDYAAIGSRLQTFEEWSRAA